MSDTLRDSPLGQLGRLVGFKSRLLYPEERTSFTPPTFEPIPKVEAAHSSEDDVERTVSKVSAAVNTPQEEVAQRLSSRNITEPIIVTWYSSTDPENPRNWSDKKKSWVISVMCLYTFVVYCSASLITPTTGYVIQRYNISIDVSSLMLALYVVGYAVGPMIFSPISEIPAIGRNPPYLYSFAVFFVVSIILAVVDNFPAILVLRFLQGFFGSPILASGGATIEDIYDMYSAPYGYIWWVAAMYCGPALGPLIPAYAMADDWRWALWIIVIMSAIVLVLLPLMPETSPQKIILHRARRLRARTGNESYFAPSELQSPRFATILWEALSKPTEIAIKDPAIGFACIYGAIVYATYYSYFECFPIVYLEIHRMSLGGLGLVFACSICGGCIVGLIVYWIYIRYYFIPLARQHHAKHGAPVAQEEWLRPALICSVGPPVGLFLFAFTAREDIHWIVPTLGIGIFAGSSFIVFQCIICYIPLTYPKYVASLFAANDFTRSIAAAVMVVVSRWMYVDLGIDRGVSIVGGLSCLGVLGMWYLYLWGAKMRSKSKFAE